MKDRKDNKLIWESYEQIQDPDFKARVDEWKNNYTISDKAWLINKVEIGVELGLNPQDLVDENGVISGRDLHEAINEEEKKRGLEPWDTYIDLVNRGILIPDEQGKEFIKSRQQ